MTEGYLYCFSNESMPGIRNVGYTDRTPKQLLDEANSSNIWKPPIPYKIEFAKKIFNPKSKETTIYKIISQYTERINDDFFRISREEVMKSFDLIDGELWVEEIINKKCRDIRECFTDGQSIRHIIDINNIWVGIYDSSINAIVCNEKKYKGRTSPLNNFASSHYKIERKDRGYTVNAWSECECEVNGKWISTDNLPSINRPLKC